MASPELLSRLTALVSSGASSIGADKSAVLEEVLDRAVALVDREAGVTYTTEPVTPTFTDYTATADGLTATFSRTGDIVTVNFTSTGVYGELLRNDLPAAYRWSNRTPYLEAYGDGWSMSFFTSAGGFESSAYLGAYMAGTYSYVYLADPLTEPTVVRVSVVPDEVLDGAYIELAVELYNRRQAPNGITQFASPDGSAMRVRMDPMDAVRPQLRPYLPGGFA